LNSAIQGGIEIRVSVVRVKDFVAAGGCTQFGFDVLHELCVVGVASSFISGVVQWFPNTVTLRVGFKGNQFDFTIGIVQGITGGDTHQQILYCNYLRIENRISFAITVDITNIDRRRELFFVRRKG